MKSLFIIIALMICAGSSLAQTNDERELYWAKSQQQKTTAWILLGLGTGSIAVGLILFDPESFYDNLLNNRHEGELSGFLILTGFVMDVGSGILFISAAHNAKKATKLSLQLETPPIVLDNGGRLVYPSVGLRIRLGPG